MQFPIEQTYGYLILDTPEKKKAAEPKLATDEYFNGLTWKKLRVLRFHYFDNLFTYRRRIDPGEGYEIVPLDDFPNTDGVECYLFGNWTSWGNSPHYALVRDALKFHPDVLAFRRKKQVWPRYWMRKINGRDTTIYRAKGQLDPGEFWFSGEWVLAVGEPIANLTASHPDEYLELTATEADAIIHPKPETKYAVVRARKFHFNTIDEARKAAERFAATENMPFSIVQSVETVEPPTEAEKAFAKSGFIPELKTPFIEGYKAGKEAAK